MSRATELLLGGTVLFLLGLALRVFTAGVEQGILALSYVGTVMMVIGGLELLGAGYLFLRK
ncbi:DUF5708 family protein [Streptomyces sp. ACA25]|uniref:DUF5708 family protein n=1 Tax=Streptomyces sp. ACA25 TaxID=3022596 RepID=UPI002307E229|nr:DUF5708 family protein [Streptomyces sp. ACA25]MDB1087833.1 DUF5708 family protein [Streptomyces sp. ACA25]